MGITISLPHQVIEDKVYTGDIGAYRMHPDGKPYHTFRTSTVLVDGDDITFRRCTFENTAGPGKIAGQAIALYIDADGIVLEDCILKGNQDTLFLAPLPPKEYEKDGFLGPKQFEPRTKRTVVLRRCLIEGSVDFIFGGATAYFDDCEFRSVAPGYVFAPCTPEDVDTGFVARNCRFTRSSSEDVPDASCYIGRPWREYAKIRVENCTFGPHIHPDGWNDWGKKNVHDTIRFEGWPCPW